MKKSNETRLSDHSGCDVSPGVAVGRRAALADMGLSLGGIALASLLGGASQARGVAPAVNPLAPRPPHFAPRAKSVILLFASGGVSQLDVFDPKPTLVAHDGKPVPEDLVKGQRFAFISGRPNLLASPYRFARHGASGMEFSELLPNLARVADKSLVIRSMHTTNVNHMPAQFMFATGHELPGRPSMGAWVVYGLGCETSDLPAFVQLSSGIGSKSKRLAGNGFLPGVYQGVGFQSGGTPIFHLADPPGVSRADRRASLDVINGLNAERMAAVGDPEIASRIAQYEMAFRMQATAPELIDLNGESPATLASYGAEPGKASLAANLLLARRLVERGVRFVQLIDGDWDHHSKLYSDLPKKCGEMDRGLAALVEDLEQRGLLDETLVIWAGEFGRTPMLEGNPDRKLVGRDHHKDAFTIWMAGGGLKRGLTYGATCELGYRIAENPVAVHDLQATILHLLGLRHESLTFRFQGRDFRLTDVHGEVVKGILA
jgi:hypothetical protein